MSEFMHTNIHTETPVGAGFYAFRHTVSAGKTAYTKLVKADRSPAPRYKLEKGIPSVGKRTRIKHRARTCARVNKEL